MVLDSWAVLRFLEGTAVTSVRVEELLASGKPLMSWINLGEVFHVLRRRVGENEAAATVRDLREVIDVRLPDVPAVLDAGRLKCDWPMSYAAAFAAALAIAHDADLWTGDPELLVTGAPWKGVDLR